MNKRRNIYRGINRKRNQVSRVMSLGIIIIALAGGNFFINKYDINLPKKFSSLNIFNKKILSLKGLSYKNLISKVDMPKIETKHENKEKEVINNKETIKSNGESAKLATVKDWGIYSVQIAVINNENELKQIQNKLEEMKVPFSIVEVDNIRKVHTYTSFKKDEVIKNLEILKQNFPDAFISKIDIPMLSLQYTKKYSYVEDICSELNALIDNFEEESKLWDKDSNNIDKEVYKNIINNRISILEKVKNTAINIDYKGMEGFKDKLLNYVELVIDKSNNSKEMLEKNQLNISESLFISSMQGYYSFINSIKSI